VQTYFFLLSGAAEVSGYYFSASVIKISGAERNKKLPFVNSLYDIIGLLLGLDARVTTGAHREKPCIDSGSQNLQTNKFA